MLSLNKGFSLIELIIVVAIIGILAAIAYPSYIDYVTKTKRTDAQSEMLLIAREMSNYKMVKNNYTGKTVSDIYGATATPKQGTAVYSLEFSPSPTTANDWTLIAKPIANTTQAANGWICLNDQGQKSWSKGINSCSLSPSSVW